MHMYSMTCVGPISDPKALRANPQGEAFHAHVPYRVIEDSLNISLSTCLFKLRDIVP